MRWQRGVEVSCQWVGSHGRQVQCLLLLSTCGNDLAVERGAASAMHASTVYERMPGTLSSIQCSLARCRVAGVGACYLLEAGQEPVVHDGAVHGLSSRLHGCCYYHWLNLSANLLPLVERQRSLCGWVGQPGVEGVEKRQCHDQPSLLPRDMSPHKCYKWYCASGIARRVPRRLRWGPRPRRPGRAGSLRPPQRPLPRINASHVRTWVSLVRTGADGEGGCPGRRRSWAYRPKRSTAMG